MKKFPQMTCALGYMLIHIDFTRLYGDKETDIYIEWPLFYERFSTTACERNLEKAKDLTILLKEELSERKYC